MANDLDLGIWAISSRLFLHGLFNLVSHLDESCGQRLRDLAKEAATYEVGCSAMGPRPGEPS